MSIVITKPGLLTTVQDLGRTHYGKYGVIVSGVMDSFSHRAANWLVGNTDQDATLEITWSGFAAYFEADHWIAITGGNLTPQLDGIDVPMWRSVFVRSGSTLTFNKPVIGCRSYIAISGGIAVREVMGSYSTYIRAGIGGYQGRALRAGDEIRVKQGWFTKRPDRMDEQAPFFSLQWSIPKAQIPSYHNHPIVRVIRGNQFDDFNEISQKALFKERFIVTPQSDRMGYRISGTPLTLNSPKEYISEAVTMGTIQVPADGQPIILMADRQTHGGYPKIAQTASIDIPVVAQIPPGGSIRFCEISQREAEEAYINWRREIRLLAMIIHQKLKEELHAEN